MNKELINQRFSKVIHTYDSEANVQKRITERLFSFIPQDFNVSSLLEIGCGSGFLTKLLVEHFTPKIAIINDLSSVWTNYVKINCLPEHWQICTQDAEEIKLQSSFDLIASASTIQWFDKPAEFIKKMFDGLNKKGVLLISSFGKNNFKEILTVTQKSIVYPSFEELTTLLPSNYFIQTFEEEITEYFPSPIDVLKHLKKTGVNAIEKSVWTKKTMEEFSNHYKRLFSIGENVSLTYHPVYLIIQKQ